MCNPIVTHEIATHNIEFEITHYVELKEKSCTYSCELFVYFIHIRPN